MDDVMAMNGFKGGIDALLGRTKIHKVGPWNQTAMKMGVLHAGGRDAAFGQYKPKGFIDPMIQTAVGLGASSLAYVVTEGSRIKGPCCGCFGDTNKVKEYLRFFTTNKKSNGVYYKLFDLSQPKNDDIPVRLYLDFDFKVETGTPWQQCWEKVSKAIECVNNGILDNVMQQSITQMVLDRVFDSNYNVCFGERDLGGGKVKFSFHVVWEQQGCRNNREQQGFLDKCLSGQNTEYDTKVYTTHQLMRTPWCGKGGNVNAVLLPTTFARVQGQWTKTTTSVEFDPDLFDKFDINVHDKSKTLLHTWELDSKGEVKVCGAKMAAKPPQEMTVASENDRIIRDFFEPLLHDYLLPMIQRHRSRLHTDLKAGGVVTASGVALAPLTTSIVERGNTPGQIRVRVSEDTFCEHDTRDGSPHYHKGTQGTLLIDYYKGWYQQLCYRCPPNEYQKKYSIFGDGCCEVSGLEYQRRESPNCLDIAPKQGAEVLLRFCEGSVLYNPDQGGLGIYHEGGKIWIVDKRTSGTMNTKKIEFVKKYKAYRTAVVSLRQAEGSRDKKVIKALAVQKKAVSKMQPLPDNTKTLMEAVLGAWESTFGSYSNVEFNKRKDLVPLHDGNCYVVKTGKMIPRTKDMYFTSHLNASIKHDHFDDECEEIRTWFLQVARERGALSLYMRRVIGLLLTGMEFDRKFYVNFGKGSNGKSLLFKMLEV
jgi:hypothetical protein